MIVSTIRHQVLYIRELQQTDRLNILSLNSQKYLPLKIFLKRDALSFHLLNITKTYVLVGQERQPRVWGYISLMCTELTLDEKQRPSETIRAKKYKTFPAIKIARLAVDKELHGHGFGRSLANTAMAIAKNCVMPYVGCRFLTVDAKEDAMNFYEKIGFSLLKTEDNIKNPNPLMLLDMHKIN